MITALCDNSLSMDCYSTVLIWHANSYYVRRARKNFLIEVVICEYASIIFGIVVCRNNPLHYFDRMVQLDKSDVIGSVDLPLRHPLAEVFGFPAENTGIEATRYRKSRLCPFNNVVPNCTKDKADNPLGVCSVFYGNGIAVTCPVRFRQHWLIAEDAATFFFPQGSSWTSLTEVRVNDNNGESAGNIDVVLVAYDDKGKVTDFGALEVQGVYITGNVRRPFEFYMENPPVNANMIWHGKPNYPRPDYLSSSRKRLVPQLLYKGGILNAWGKKVAVALDKGFFQTLPYLEEVDSKSANIAWLIYDLKLNETGTMYDIKREKTVYTMFNETMDRIAKPSIGSVDEFVGKLQAKLDEKLENEAKPDTRTILDLGD
jgi:Restriction endonuclease NotI